MKGRLLTAMAVLSLGLGMAWAGQFEDGVAAYERGDNATALRLFQSLAKQGNAEAQYRLGNMYDDGKGVTQDYAEAVKWFRLTAAQGKAEAQTNLGVMYKDGQGVAQDYAEAVKWFRLAAVQGAGKAQTNLGVMYATGRGVAQDYVRAHMWFNLGAVSGYANAVSGRDLAAKRMTPQQIAQAQKMARDCQERKFKGCD